MNFLMNFDALRVGSSVLTSQNIYNYWIMLEFQGIISGYECFEQRDLR